VGFSKIWVHGESTEVGVATITLELLAKARELADVVEVVMAGDADAVAAELGDHGASTVHTIGALNGGLSGHGSPLRSPRPLVPVPAPTYCYAGPPMTDGMWPAGSRSS